MIAVACPKSCVIGYFVYGNNSWHAGQSQPFIASVHQAGAMSSTPRDERRAAGTSYPALWRTWNSRCVMSLTGQEPEQRPAAAATRELIRGSPVPVRAHRDDERAASPALDAPRGGGGVRKFTMDQFQREFGPCLTYSAPASPLHKRLSIESTEAIPLSGGAHPRRVAQPTVPTPFTAAAQWNGFG